MSSDLLNVTHKWGQIVILNGTPRSGKSSIARIIQESFDEPWLNLGVDVFMKPIIPQRFRPAIGLRPGGEAPHLEPYIVKWYAALYESIAAHSRLGINVVVDVGHHDYYSQPLGILFDCARRLAGLPVLFVGVRCPLAVIMERRRNTWGSDDTADDVIPPPVLLWQEAVHKPGIYDLEVDTSMHSPEACAHLIAEKLAEGPPLSAFEQLASMSVE